MPILRIKCLTRSLFLLLLTTPLLSLGSGNRSKPQKVKEQPEPSEITRAVYRIMANEWQLRTKLKEYSPRVETYLQYYQGDRELGETVTQDAYFLGRLNFTTKKIENRAGESSFIKDSSYHRWRKHVEIPKVHLQMDEFAVEPLVVDENHFDRQHYTFTPVRWEYLGDVRCLAIDVHPRDSKGAGAFLGRIWVEDQNYAIVRLNGTRLNPPRKSLYFHFDCWRENLQPGLWLPVYVYSEESDHRKSFRYKSESRLWGYDLTASRKQQEWTNILVEAPLPVRDSTDSASDLSPLESKRQFTAQAEQNVLDRLEKARLVAPPGPVDKVLETVVNNLKVTNQLVNVPPLHCRVLLTSTLESFSLAHTIVLSRGLIDVLPDEATLAMILAHELGHIALGQKLDTKYAFNDRLQNTDEQLLASLDLARDSKDETAADAKGIEFLKNSPYKNSLGQAGLFLRAAVDAAPHIPHLLGNHLGNGLTERDSKLTRMAELMSGAPALNPKSLDQKAALPLGSWLQVNAWDGAVSLSTRSAVPLEDASEKLPFRVTPLIPHLRRFAPPSQPEVSAGK